MNSKAISIQSAVAAFMVQHRIPSEMEQNLIKEAIHLHLLSALSDAGVLRHVVFQGGPHCAFVMAEKGTAKT